MHFFEAAEKQPCYYCKRISRTEQQDDYPVRDGVYTHEGYVYRCAWHARFTCSRCGKPYHFSWFYWCPTTHDLVCGHCNEPRLKPVRFWDRTYAYEFFCEACNDTHYDLLYSEFCGTHPWQVGCHDVASGLDVSSPWLPSWSPRATRSGQKTALEESLRLENRVTELRKELSTFVPVKSAVPEAEMDQSDTQEAWERFSKHWLEITDKSEFDSGDLNRRLVIDPALMNLIGSIEGLHILDAGCGNGYLSRKLSRMGAHVVGVDFTRSFIDYANQRESELKLGTRFQQASLDDLSDFESGMFDIVVSNVVMVDVVNFQQAFIEISRVLKDDGRFIWSNTHPVFGGLRAFDPRLPSDSPRNEERYLKMLERYYDSGGTLLEWDGHRVWQIDRTLEEYSRALREASFVISQILEPRPTIEQIQEHPAFLAFDADRWTQFIVFECRKAVGLCE